MTPWSFLCVVIKPVDGTQGNDEQGHLHHRRRPSLREAPMTAQTLDRSAPTVAPESRPVVPKGQAPVVRPGNRRARRALWWVACLICGGLLGLVLAIVGTLRGRPP